MTNSPEPDFRPADVMVIDDLETLKLIYDPLRLQILEAFGAEPRSVKQVAADLSMRPNKLYYHVNRLEAAGILKMVRTQIIGHMVEKLYQTAARHFQMKRDNLSAATSADISQARQKLLLGFDLFLRTTERNFTQGLESQQIDLFQNPPHPHALLLWNGYTRLSPSLAIQTQQKILDLLSAIGKAPPPLPEEGSLQYAYAVVFIPTALVIGQDEELTAPSGQASDDQKDFHEHPAH
jgi:DNA-binding transcriptional ArsR family regulator